MSFKNPRKSCGDCVNRALVGQAAMCTHPDVSTGSVLTTCFTARHAERPGFLSRLVLGTPDVCGPEGRYWECTR